MWTDRYSVEHRVSTATFARSRLRRFARGLVDPWVKPLETPLKTAFVVGCGHSGTTLLAAKLGRLEGCHVPGWETNIFLPDRGLIWSKAACAALLKTAETTGGKLMLEKTPKHVHCASRILSLLPQARFLVMTRNPLDNCASLFERFGRLDEAIERWNLDNRAALELLKIPLSRQVRYEDLVTRPAHTFEAAATFIGLRWDPTALDSGETAYSIDVLEANMALRAEQVSRAIEPKLETWRERLSTVQAQKVLAETAAVASLLGYPPSRDHSPGGKQETS